MTLYEAIVTFVYAFFPDGIDYFDELIIDIFIHILVYFIIFFIIYTFYKLLVSIFKGFKK